ncbi:unnamed protein product [Cyclocybe aegerita]|uniref:Nephrocystin 3-like N-terminal domain-containing protein n=1 Tax=Cyclocybe aegerita TaxID=1973307 RepID=A0A8S0VRR9_CYCAE|nr:unnamed protein product [Cyclocybe aegerita]
MMFGDNVFITGGTFSQQNGPAPNLGFKTLQKFVCAAALHDSSDRFDAPKCHPQTRVAVLNKIMDWATGKIDETAFILWLYGPAGAGKTAILQTIAEMCTEAGFVLASFFFYRTDARRNDGSHLVATLAYQMALAMPPFRKLVNAAVEYHPYIFECSIEKQLIALIVHPLLQLAQTSFFAETAVPVVTVVDGLDECQDHVMQRQVIEAIHAIRTKAPPFLKLLIASRAEPQIMATFSTLDHLSISKHLVLDDEYKPNEDIRIFLRDRFKKIRTTHLFKSFIPKDWPGDDVLDVLVNKSSGQFVYASVVMRFLDSPRHRPTDRLEIVRGLRPPDRELPFAELDALYRHIFSTVQNLPMVLRMFGVRYLVPEVFSKRFSVSLQGTNAECTVSDLAQRTLCLSDGDLNVLCADLTPIVSCNFRGTVKDLHASLNDFLRDPTRSGDYAVNFPQAYADIGSFLCRSWDIQGLWNEELLLCCRNAALTEDFGLGLLTVGCLDGDATGWRQYCDGVADTKLPAVYALLQILATKKMCRHCRGSGMDMLYADIFGGGRRGGWFDPYDGFGLGGDVNRSYFAPVSDRAKGALENAKAAFLNHLATVDTSKGTVTDEIVKFHLVPDMRKAFNKFVKEYGCIGTSRQLTRAEQDLINKTRKSLMWYTSVIVTPEAQRAYLEKHPNIAKPARTTASASTASTYTAVASTSTASASTGPLNDANGQKIKHKLKEAAAKKAAANPSAKKLSHKKKA